MNNLKKKKTKEDYLLEVVENLEKYLNCLKLTIEKKGNQIFQFNKILKAINIEYRKLFNENKSLIDENKKIKQNHEHQITLATITTKSTNESKILQK